MDKKKKIITMILGIVIITLCSVATYAYFTANITGNSANKNTKVDMSKMKLEFSDKTGKVVADSINPGWTYQKKVSVTNTGTVPVKYDLVWLSLQNEIEQDEMVYSIECSNCNGIDEYPVPSYGGENLKIVTNTIEATQTQEYTINFTFKEINDLQDYNQNKVFTGNIGIKENNTYEEVPVGILSDTDWEYTLDEENNKVTLTRYVSSNPNVEIYPTYVKDNKQYKTVIEGSSYSGMYYKTIFKARGAMSYDSKIESVKFMENVEFKYNNISWLFTECDNLKEVDVSKLDTSNIKDMSGMFFACNALTNLDLSSFNTSNVTSMDYMFTSCRSLTSLDLSNFDTSKVTRMFEMFYNCNSLTNVNLSSFDTSNVTDMNYMFVNCSSLTNLDLSNFDTSNETNMNRMFSGCSSLTNLDLSNFDTSNVINMNNMFEGCSALKKLNIAKFNFNEISSTSCYPSFSNVPTDIEITTNEDIKNWLNENYPNITNITVV